ncbi:MAG: hypothetical protein AABX29_02620 [Nanoarchaeota archaeon]
MEEINKIRLNEFLEGQQKTYDKFRKNLHLVREKGVFPSNVVQDTSRGGYAITLRHSYQITEPLTEFSLAISRATPAMVFDETNAHTTVIPYEIKPNFVLDGEIIQKMLNGVHGVWNDLRTIEIDYCGWLYNQDSVIAEGYADMGFIRTINTLLLAISEKGIKDMGGRKAWGGFITTSRFTEPRSPKELGDFFQLMDNSPSKLGYSRPPFLDVGIVEYKADSFTYTTIERFEF